MCVEAATNNQQISNKTTRMIGKQTITANKNLGHGGGGSSSSVLHFQDSTSLKSNFRSMIVFGRHQIFNILSRTTFTYLIWLKGFGSVIQRSAWKEIVCFSPHLIVKEIVIKGIWRDQPEFRSQRRHPPSLPASPKTHWEHPSEKGTVIKINILRKCSGVETKIFLTYQDLVLLLEPVGVHCQGVRGFVGQVVSVEVLLRRRRKVNIDSRRRYSTFSQARTSWASMWVKTHWSR